ncbi:nucleic acid-binding domain protein [Cooperia oncophora]
MGWLAYKRMNRFLVLRDPYGLVQAVVNPESELCNVVKDLPYESIVQVEGSVISRGENTNLKMKTGEIEVGFVASLVHFHTKCFVSGAKNPGQNNVRSSVWKQYKEQW